MSIIESIETTNITEELLSFIKTSLGYNNYFDFDYFNIKKVIIQKTETDRDDIIRDDIAHSSISDPYYYFLHIYYPKPDLSRYPKLTVLDKLIGVNQELYKQLKEILNNANQPIIPEPIITPRKITNSIMELDI